MGVRQAEKFAKISGNKARIRQQMRLENARIERIHRTEISRLKHFSDKEALKQAKMTGKIKDALKTWRKTGFNDNWESSDLNDGVTVDIEETFPSGDEYPSEINERCILEYSVRK
jgi:hypothetical protein